MAKLLIAAVLLAVCVGQASCSYGPWYDYSPCDCSDYKYNPNYGTYLMKRDCYDTDIPCDYAYEERRMPCKCDDVDLTPGEIAGIVVGCVVFLILVIILVVWCCYCCDCDHCCHHMSRWDSDESIVRPKVIATPAPQIISAPAPQVVCAPQPVTYTVTQPRTVCQPLNFGPAVVTHQTPKPSSVAYIVN